MGSRVWLRVQTFTYVRVKELVVISRMTAGKILLLPHGGFAKCQEVAVLGTGAREGVQTPCISPWRLKTVPEASERQGTPLSPF